MNADSVRASHEAIVAAVELTARIYQHELVVSNVLAFLSGAAVVLVGRFLILLGRYPK